MNTRTLRTLVVILASLEFGACKGADGSTGPPGQRGEQGPPGPAGPSGALNRADLRGVIGSSGAVTAILPSSATLNGRVPVIACYISDNGVTWLAVAQTPESAGATFCGLTNIGSSSAGITLINAPVGWQFYLIAVW